MDFRLSERPARASIAVCYSGWLGVSIPRHGFTAFKALIEPLDADTFIAGTYREGDCGAVNITACWATMHPRFRRLGPLTSAMLESMPTRESLRTQLETSRWWRRISTEFHADKTFAGLSLFSPVLGSPEANVLRELVSYERVYHLVQAAEQQRSQRYESLIFSRLEYWWIAPHPPLMHLEGDVLWTPTADAFGISDRHAVMPRHMGDAYFRRWSALLSPTVHPRFAIQELVTTSPEAFLGMHMQREATGRHDERDAPPRFRLGDLPLPAFLACCQGSSRAEGSNRCWAKECHEQPLLPRKVPCERTRPARRPLWSFLTALMHTGGTQAARRSHTDGRRMRADPTPVTLLLMLVLPAPCSCY